MQAVCGSGTGDADTPAVSTLEDAYSFAAESIISNVMSHESRPHQVNQSYQVVFKFTSIKQMKYYGLFAFDLRKKLCNSMMIHT